jgi:hypothetical protein
MVPNIVIEGIADIATLALGRELDTELVDEYRPGVWFADRASGDLRAIVPHESVQPQARPRERLQTLGRARALVAR